MTIAEKRHESVDLTDKKFCSDDVLKKQIRNHARLESFHLKKNWGQSQESWKNSEESVEEVEEGNYSANI
jgi:hypothetical protein